MAAMNHTWTDKWEELSRQSGSQTKWDKSASNNKSYEDASSTPATGRGVPIKTR